MTSPLAKALSKELFGVHNPTFVGTRLGPGREITRVKSAVRATEVLGTEGQHGDSLGHRLQRGVNGGFHPLGVEGRERRCNGWYTVQACFPRRSHGAAVVGILREVGPEVHTGHHELRMNAGDEVVQTAIQGDDHRVAGGPVQLKQVNGCS